jgi:N-ethylmaleimide reductase
MIAQAMTTAIAEDPQGYDLFSPTTVWGFDRDGAQEILRRGDADLAAFGRWFSSNPDLPERLRQELPLTQYNREAFWGGDERGYIDHRAHT